MDSQTAPSVECPNCSSSEIRSKVVTIDRKSGKRIRPVARWITGGGLVAFGACMALSGLAMMQFDPAALFIYILLGSLFLVPGAIVIIKHLQTDKAKLTEHRCGACKYKWKRMEGDMVAGAPAAEGTPPVPQSEISFLDGWQTATPGGEPSSIQIELSPAWAVLTFPGAKRRISKADAAAKIEFPDTPFDGQGKADHLNGSPVIHFGNIENIVLKPDAYERLQAWVPPKESRETLAEKNRKRMIRGLLWTVAGILITAITYSIASDEGGTYFICWGAVIFGLLDLLAGLVGWLRYR